MSERILGNYGQRLAGPPAKKAGVHFQFSKWNVLAAAGLFLASAIFFVVELSLFWEEEPTGSFPVYGWYMAAYWLLTLLGCCLWLLEITLPDAARRWIGWGLVLLMPLGAFFAVDMINSTRILKFTLLRGFANYLCYLMVFVLIYAISRRVWVTALAGGIIFLVFGIANYFVVQFRGQPILPWDIQSFSTAMAVSGGYEYVPTHRMALSALGFFCTLALCVKLGPKGKAGSTRAFRISERLGAFLISLTLFFLLFPLDILTSMGISVWAWNQKTSSELTGVAAGFFANIQFVLVDKPAGYSPGRARTIAGEHQDPEVLAPLGAPEKAPTIIVVMSESMTDLEKVGDVEFTADPQPFSHSLEGTENVIWGTAYSSVYGGNTCNSEYEFLTGNTMAFLPTGSKPYQQYIDGPQTALPSILKEQGYSCTAIHPGSKRAWQRDEAYPNLGFDKFVSVGAFDVKRELIAELTSDASHFDQVIYEYEHRDKNRPQFLFTVTIQNHGGYEEKGVPTTVRVKGAEGQFPQTEQYLSMLQISDRALEEFIGYFEQEEEPVVVLFFGDHWPNLETGFLTKLLGTDAGSLNFENMMRQYQVPFYIWANYPLQGQKVEQVSLNYLSGLLLRAAGLEGTAYTNFLEELRGTLPVITAVGTMDKDGQLYKNGQCAPYNSLLQEYAILQYNNAFDESGKVKEAFLP